MKKLTLLLIIAGTLQALPENPQVVQGSVDVQAHGPHCEITQQSDKAIVNWDSFNISQVESVRFAQPSSSSVILNRIVGHNPTEIYGSLSANGQVFLINPQGVLFAPGAQINAAGFVASTLDIQDRHFLEGHYRFVGEGGTVRHAGTIKASEGYYIALLGGRVISEGRLEVSKGAVSLAAGGEISLALNDAGFLYATVTKESLQAAVDHQGTIDASGSTVVLSAHDASAILTNVVNNTGVIKASSLTEENGRIILKGGKKGIVSNSGTLDVSGKNKGGTISLMGEYVANHQNGKILATGKLGGGAVTLGFEGEELSKRTFLAKDSKIDVSSAQGDAGTIHVWSEEKTVFHGYLMAEAPKGKGGFVETSSKDGLNIGGKVSARGKTKELTGTWCLDPTDLTINSGSTNTGEFNLVDGVEVWTDAGNATTILGDAVILSNLDSANVLINTVGGSGVQASPSITISDNDVDIHIPEGRTLTLQTGSGGVLWTAGGISGPGALVFTAENGGDVAINNPVLPGGDVVLASLTVTECGSFIVGNRVNTGAANITSEGTISFETDQSSTPVQTMDLTSTGGAGTTVSVTMGPDADKTARLNTMIIPNAPDSATIETIDGSPLTIATDTTSWNLSTPARVNTTGGGYVTLDGYVAGSDLTLEATVGDRGFIGTANSLLEVPDGGTITFSAMEVGGSLNSDQQLVVSPPINIDMPSTASVNVTILDNTSGNPAHIVNLNMVNDLSLSQVTVSNSLADPIVTVSLSAPNIAVNDAFGVSDEALSLTATQGNITFTGNGNLAGSTIALAASGSIERQNGVYPTISTSGPLDLTATNGVAGTIASPLMISAPSRTNVYAGGAINNVSVVLSGPVSANTIYWGATYGFVILNGVILNMPAFLADQYVAATAYTKTLWEESWMATLAPGSIAAQQKTTAMMNMLNQSAKTVRKANKL